MGVIDISDVNVDKELNDIENCIRNFINYVMKNKFGENYLCKLGVNKEKIEKWENRLKEEKIRLNGKQLDNRLLYYSDFYDLQIIISKNWELFSDVFKSKKEIEYQLSVLESYRNPNAHNRELLMHQKHYLIVIIGEIKMSILEYRGNVENENTYFPSIESIQINGKPYDKNYSSIKQVLKKGDIIEISLFCLIPPNQKLFCAIREDSNEIEWKENKNFVYEVGDELQYGINRIYIYIKSDQQYHKINDSCFEFDDICIVDYTLVP